MQKYTQFRDQASGINPFLHEPPKSGSNLFTADNTLNIGLFGKILIVIRAPLFYTALCLWYILTILPVPVCSDNINNFFNAFYRLKKLMPYSPELFLFSSGSLN